MPADVAAPSPKHSAPVRYLCRGWKGEVDLVQFQLEAPEGPELSYLIVIAIEGCNPSGLGLDKRQGAGGCLFPFRLSSLSRMVSTAGTLSHGCRKKGGRN